MHEFNPWDSGCMGCAQEAMMRERSFESIKMEAEEYAKKNKIDLVIFMEGQEWKYLNVTAAAELGIFFGREIIRFDQHSHDGPVHQVRL